jgi:hypothetical protein
VVVPEAWHGWDDERRRAILLHEGEHVRQGDFWWQLAAGLYRALFWFNPLGWWLARRLRDLAERRSDDRVVATPDRADYAGLLLEFGARVLPSPACHGAPPPGLRIERIPEGGGDDDPHDPEDPRLFGGLARRGGLRRCAWWRARRRADRPSSARGQRRRLPPATTRTGVDDSYVYVHGANATIGRTDDLKRAHPSR